MIVLTTHQLAMQALAKEIYDWCIKEYCWSACTIYFNGKAWSDSPEWGGVKGKKIGDELYEYEDKNPKDYFEYANPDTLSMAFEGPLYDILNGYYHGWSKREEKFCKIFKKYGMYYEFGYSWSLSAYEL